MPAIYYTYYDNASGTVSEISRLEHDLGRALLIKGLNDIYDLNYSAEDADALISAGPSGKPFLPDHPDIFFNITHASGLVACAFHDSPVGIDVELPGYFPEVLIGRALTESERSLLMSCSHDESLRQECFWRLWTLKEAYVKKSGIGVDSDLRAFSFAFDVFNSPDTGVPLQIRCSDQEVSCFQLFLKSTHIVSVCISPAEDVSIFDIVEKIDLCHEIAEDNNGEHDPHS